MNCYCIRAAFWYHFISVATDDSISKFDFTRSVAKVRNKIFILHSFNGKSWPDRWAYVWLAIQI